MYLTDLLEGPVPTWNCLPAPAATQIQTQINLPVCNASDTNGPRRVIENEDWTRKLCKKCERKMVLFHKTAFNQGSTGIRQCPIN